MRYDKLINNTRKFDRYTLIPRYLFSYIKFINIIRTKIMVKQLW